jgi:integrase
VKVQVGTTTLRVSPHLRGWRFGFKGATGRWEYVTRKDKGECVEAARGKARELSNAYADIKLSVEEAALWLRVQRLKVTHAELDALEASRNQLAVGLDKAADEFLAQKKANRGRSERDVRSLSGDLGSLKQHFKSQDIRTIKLVELEAWLATFEDVGKRRRKNLRGAAVRLFRWARKRGYVADATTEAEKLENPRIEDKTPETWDAAEMAIMLKACHQQHGDYIPWLILAGFEHFRREELFVDKRSDKIPLDWEDFNWEEEIIRVKPETAKLGKARIVPILPVVRAWLYPMRKEKGRICPTRPPDAKSKKLEAITTKLGSLVGGWRDNALRHSSISYRAVEKGLGVTAMEAGNSEAECKSSYNNAKTQKEAAAWYELTPEKVLRLKPHQNISEHEPRLS